MGGTFDPIHLGHLRAAENAREALGLDLVAFVPAGVPPHRESPSASARDRFVMVCLATAGHPHFVASDRELERQGPSYTVDTLRALREEHPHDTLVLLVGSDAFAALPSWREPERIRELAQVAVVSRPGAHPQALPPGAGSIPIEHVDGPGLDISSSRVRRRIAEGRSIRYLVPEAVADYIAKRALYQ